VKTLENKDTSLIDVDINDLQEVELFADELDERLNAGTVSSFTCMSSASTGGTSSASCLCSTSSLCSSEF
jgi:hypothetical protein